MPMFILKACKEHGGFCVFQKWQGTFTNGNNGSAAVSTDTVCPVSALGLGLGLSPTFPHRFTTYILD